MSPTHISSGQGAIARFATAQDMLATLIGHAATLAHEPEWAQRMRNWMQQAQTLTVEDSASIDRILRGCGTALRELAQQP